MRTADIRDAETTSRHHDHRSRAQSQRIAKKRPTLAGPKYRQIQNHLLRQLREGAFTPNEPLPGERSLAVSLDVAVGTLRQALRKLEIDGFIRREPGRGTFVNSPQERREQVKTNVFSVIVPMIAEEPYPDLFQGVEHAAEGRYRITVGSAKHDPAQQERLLRHAVKDNVAGVVIVPTASPTPAEHIRMLQEKHIPVVFCHRPVAGVEAPLVCWSFEQSGRIAAEVLLKHGHRRIIHLASMRYETVLSIAAGVRSTMQEHGVDDSQFNVHYYGVMLRDKSHEELNTLREVFCEILERIFREKDRPTAIICHSLVEAELLYFSASDLGFNIPKDLSLVYFGGNRPQGALSMRLTCVSRNEREMGEQAGRLLCEMSSGRRPLDSRERIEIPLELLPGETVGPPPQSGG